MIRIRTPTFEKKIGDNKTIRTMSRTSKFQRTRLAKKKKKKKNMQAQQFQTDSDHTVGRKVGQGQYYSAKKLKNNSF